MSRTIETFRDDASRKRIAVVGSGVAGLGAAWLLSKSADVTVFEADDRLGGHSHTSVIPDGPGRSIAVDTGFIVYNKRNYPNLVALFNQLGVKTRASDMSFSASLEDGAFEYSGAGIPGIFAQGRNLLMPRFWKMTREIGQFYGEAKSILANDDLEDVSLGEFLDRKGYTPRLVDDHLLPMGAAIWSTTAKDMRAFPLKAFIRFFESHGLLNVVIRPEWRTVDGGAQEYVRKIAKEISGPIHCSSPVVRVSRERDGVHIQDARGNTATFDDVVLACHADQTLKMLADPSPEERRLLGSFRYTDNLAVLHRDPAQMPRRRPLWASWNYVEAGDTSSERLLCVTYWMNKLQRLKSRTPIFVTLNPARPIRSTIWAGTYEHPVFDTTALMSQRQLWSLQGKRNTWFCGAYFGSGFHEDGLQAGLAVAEALGRVERPWRVRRPSDRIFLQPVPVPAE